MNAIRAHIPAYMRDPQDAETLKWVDFSTLEELLEISFVHNFCENAAPSKIFSHYAKSDDLLMAVYNDGYSWLVVGYLKDPDSVDLSYWEAKYKEGEHDGICRNN